MRATYIAVAGSGLWVIEVEYGLLVERVLENGLEILIRARLQPQRALAGRFHASGGVGLGQA
jgi:hypothetical protein